MSALATLHVLDVLIVLAYAAGVVALGLWSKRRQRTTRDYFLGGGRIPWWAIGVSLIATSFSTLSLIGGTDSGFTSNYQYLQFQVGDLLAMLVVCFLFLPFFAKLDLATAYAYLEQRFGPYARRLASALFHLTILLRVGPILATTAIVGAAVIGTDEVEWVIVAVGLAAMAYSAVGGLGAVVWTDLVQMVLIVGGVLACIGIGISDLPGGVRDVVASAEAKQGPPSFDFSLDPARWPTLFTSALAYGVLALSIFGTNQHAVQRFLACPDVGAARRAGLLGWAVGVVVMALTLTLGVVIAAWYQSKGGSGEGTAVLGRFLADRVPIGLTGILAAAILAACMSSMDSAIHSMSTATLVDFVDPFRPGLTEAERLRYARGLVWVYGLLTTGVALLSLKALGSADVIQVVLRWLTAAAGPILGLFLLAILTRRPRERDAVIAVLAGCGAAALLTFVKVGPAGKTPLIAHLGLHPIWTCAVTAALTWVVGILLSRVPARGAR